MFQSRSGKQHAIEQILEKQASSNKVIAALVSNEEGLPIASRVESKTSEYLLSAMAATLLTTATAAAFRLEMGTPDIIRVELKTGTLLVREIREHACLLLVVKKDANLPYFDIVIKKMIGEIDRVLFPDLFPEESPKTEE
jgi:predicted regulator of Ras-like GTPase activity (Roadblock/LC7/MglB family)